jgi:hypothetical protein
MDITLKLVQLNRGYPSGAASANDAYTKIYYDTRIEEDHLMYGGHSSTLHIFLYDLHLGVVS